MRNPLVLVFLMHLHQYAVYKDLAAKIRDPDFERSKIYWFDENKNKINSVTDFMNPMIHIKGPGMCDLNLIINLT